MLLPHLTIDLGGFVWMCGCFVVVGFSFWLLGLVCGVVFIGVGLLV